jgi:hypothetical protein
MKSNQKPITFPKNIWKNPYVLAGIIATGYWVYNYHLDHALEFLPYTILLLCPLLHIFMHGGHNHGNNDGSHDSQGDHENHKDHK